jgi:hypothetical protein
MKAADMDPSQEIEKRERILPDSDSGINTWRHGPLTRHREKRTDSVIQLQ